MIATAWPRPASVTRTVAVDRALVIVRLDFPASGPSTPPCDPARPAAPVPAAGWRPPPRSARRPTAGRGSPVGAVRDAPPKTRPSERTGARPGRQGRQRDPDADG